MRLLTIFFLFLSVKSAKILIWPAEWSHWINMKVKKSTDIQLNCMFKILYLQIIIKKLVENGHKVTVMRSSAYTDFLTDDFDIVKFYDFEVSRI